MKVLHLTLKKKWFDMIDSGEKTEEYRTIKRHWIARLIENSEYLQDLEDIELIEISFIKFDAVEFVNGYSLNAPRFTIKCDSIYISDGRPEWGAEPGKKYFVIKLGEKIKN